ncbi:sushi, von Willebrand factor type A, EGF and pentraxin domain-containing protein 1-like, partial [Mercenaria mercenaria]|uniref:sushi, von Willebrand factor type A, EGF and pentraxin domain-containing protein 1-like n=1 Tax=Mercenaria mercenaria TaxID=6596 RepID=UPI00234EE9A6
MTAKIIFMIIYLCIIQRINYVYGATRTSTASATSDTTDCGSLSKLYMPNAHERYVINGTKYNSIANIYCDAGYREQNQMQIKGVTKTLIRCNENGTWENLPICVRKDCGSIWMLNIPNARDRREMNGTKYSSVANISCDVGYRAQNKIHTESITSTLIRCYENGTWGNLPTCVRKNCGKTENLHINNTQSINLRRENTTTFESNATVLCKTGYAVTGEYGRPKKQYEITCGSSGRWETVKACIRIDCGKTENLHINNTQSINLRRENTTTFESNATVLCKTGYAVTGEYGRPKKQYEITCGSSGRWETVKACIRIDCGKTENLHINNTQSINLRRENTTTFESNATVLCKTGYAVTGEYGRPKKQYEITCGSSGRWETVKACIRIDCGKTENLHINNTQSINLSRENATKFESNATVLCKTGYAVTGVYGRPKKQYEITCGSSGRWETVMDCIRIDCGNIDMLNISNANSWFNFTDTKYLSNATISCDTGYTDQNKPQVLDISTSWITCSANGTWANVPKCVRKDCGNIDMLNISNANSWFNFTDTKYLSNATISCDTGYTDQNKPQVLDISTSWITCSANGTWANVPKCVRKDCGNIDMLNISNANSWFNFTDTKYLSNATISCDTGYTDQNKPQVLDISTSWITCSANGTWANVPKCVRKDCGNIDMLNISNANSWFNFTDTKYLSNATISCDTGYTDQNKPQVLDISTSWITCSANGTWANVPKCVRKDCGNIDMLNISNANSWFNFTDTKYLSNATISCDTGYTDQNKPQVLDISTSWITCSANGTWANVPKCVRKDCGNVHYISINNAANRRLHNDTKYTSTAEIDCDEGYYNINDIQTSGISTTTIRCSENGTWVYMPTCVRKDCSDIHNISIKNALKRRMHNDTKYTSTAEIDCDEGYYNINDIQTSGISTTTIRCSENGMWVNVPTCVRKDCGNIDMLNISNAKTKIVFTDTKYQSNATISCDTGYTDQNKRQTLGISTYLITCSANGTWANVPQCVRK